MDILETENNNKKLTPSTPVVILGSLVGGFAIMLSTVSIPFIAPFFRKFCLPYVPATTAQVLNVMEALEGRSGRLIDLGSGDGRIVIAAAQFGFQATGVELNPALVFFSRLSAYHCGVALSAKFFRYDLWKLNLRPFQNVVIFGVEQMMPELEKKFKKELVEDAHIFACRFPLTSLKPIRVVGTGIDTVWVYKI